VLQSLPGQGRAPGERAQGSAIARDPVALGARKKDQAEAAVAVGLVQVLAKLDGSAEDST
jgi:hypothetical protein